MKRKYSAERMGRFLRHELDRYLQQRSFEREKEMPLERVEQQNKEGAAKFIRVFAELTRTVADAPELE